MIILMVILEVISIMLVLTNTFFNGVSSDVPRYESLVVITPSQIVTMHRFFHVYHWVTVVSLIPFYWVTNFGYTLSSRCAFLTIFLILQIILKTSCRHFSVSFSSSSCFLGILFDETDGINFEGHSPLVLYLLANNFSNVTIFSFVWNDLWIHLWIISSESTLLLLSLVWIR